MADGDAGQGVHGSFAESGLSALVGTAVDGILAIDASGTVRLCNPAAERLFGRAASEIVGHPIARLMPTRYAKRHDGYVRRYVETGEARIIGIGREVEGRRADGAEFPMHLSVGEFRAGNERFFVGIVRDLTAEKREAERLRKLEEQLNLAGRRNAVSEMGAALAHELNQPLTAVNLFLVAAERAMASDPEKARDYFARARSEAERAGGIVRQIRQMVEPGSHEKAFFSLREAAEGAAELCRLGARDQHVRIEVGDVPDVLVFGDEIQVRQVLVNLIRNGLDATRDRACRVVRIEGAARDFVELDVVDNGPGVSEGFQSRLFEPFASTKNDGLGIGLAICKTIAENHGGELTLVLSQDRDGLGGARFRLRLPHEGREGEQAD